MTAGQIATGLGLVCALNLACGGSEPAEPEATPPPPPEPNRCVVTPVETGIEGTLGANLALTSGAEGLAITGSAVEKGETSLQGYPLDAAGVATGDPVRLEARGDAGSSDHAVPVWTGTEWVVVWDTYTKKDTPSYRGKVHLARFGADGTLVGRSRAISDDRWDIASPRLAWSGAGAGAVWSSSPDQEAFALSFRPLDTEGKPSGPTVDLAEVPRHTPVAISWDGSAYGIVWTAKVGNRRELFFARVSPVGEVEVPAVQVTTGGAGGDLGLVVTADGYGAVWTEYRGGSYVMYASLSREGLVAGKPRQVNEGGRAIGYYGMATSGTEIGVVWTDGSANENTSMDDMHSDLYFARLSEAGEILTPPQQVTDFGGRSISAIAAWKDGAWFVGRDPYHVEPLLLYRLTDCDTPN